MAIKIDEKGSCLTFDVRVVPRSSKSEIVGEHGGSLRIKLKSPPVDGAANDELIILLSKELNVSRSAVEIVSGQSSKTKRIRIESVDAVRIRALLKAKS